MLYAWESTKEEEYASPANKPCDHLKHIYTELLSLHLDATSNSTLYKLFSTHFRKIFAHFPLQIFNSIPCKVIQTVQEKSHNHRTYKNINCINQRFFLHKPIQGEWSFQFSLLTNFVHC